MTGKSRQLMIMLGLFLALAFWLILPGLADADCDTLDRPVVAEARESVQAGRECVEAYVTDVHHVEEIAQLVHGGPHHGEKASEPSHRH